MRKKFKILINLFVLFFVIFYPIKLSASQYACELLIDKIVSGHEPGFSYMPMDDIRDDFGFRLVRDWNEKTQEWPYRKDKNGNFIVGRIHDKDLAQNLKSGNSIIKINDQKFILNEGQIDMLVSSEKVKLEFFDQKKGNFVLNLKKKKYYLTQAWLDVEDISVNSIDLKKGFFEVYLKYDTAYRLSKDEFENFNNLVQEAIVRVTGGEFGWEICRYSEEDYQRSRLSDPGHGIELSGLAKIDKDLVEVYYKLTPYSKEMGNQKDLVMIEKKLEGFFSIKNDFNLRAFPFDKQKLSLNFIDEQLGLEDRVFVVSDLIHESLNRFVEKNDISGWNVKKYEINSFQYHDVFMMEKDFADSINIDILIERKHGYYIFKVIIPIVLILMLCWSVVWIHPRELESRLTITIVCLLSLIAYNFVIDAELPKLEYLTVLDWIILISYFYAAIPNFLTIASFKFHKTNEPLSMKLESYGKRYGPTSYVGIIIFIIFLNANLNPENTSALISWMAGR